MTHLGSRSLCYFDLKRTSHPSGSRHGYVDTLLLKNETLTNEERRHYLEIARKHTQRLGQLIGDLFELSKLDAHSIKPVLEIFSLAELLHDVSQEFELDAEKRNISLQVIAPPQAAMLRHCRHRTVVLCADLLMSTK